MYLKDRENAELLGMTHPQYMAVKYQAESLIHATEDESDHSYGNLYDPSEYLKDYCALAMHRETWDEDLMLRSSKDYSKIVTQISLRRQTRTGGIGKANPLARDKKRWPDQFHETRTEVVQVL